MKKKLICWIAICLLIGLSVLTAMVSGNWFVPMLLVFIIGAPLCEYFDGLEKRDGRTRSAADEARRLQDER